MIRLKRLFRLILVLCGVWVLAAGCKATIPDSAWHRLPQTTLRSVELVKSLLHAQVDEWHGVRYRIGGLSKSGIDCSGFVYITFQNRFGVTLPRTTEDQARVGKKISPRHLEPGDLVFFKTGWFDRHVGIYIDTRRFAHVSTKKGVMVSNLDDPYWKKRYWKAVRIYR